MVKWIFRGIALLVAGRFFALAISVFYGYHPSRDLTVYYLCLGGGWCLIAILVSFLRK